MANTNSIQHESNLSFSQRSELVLAVALLVVLVVLLVPLPTMLLDLLLAANFALTILVLLITLSATQPLDFSVFPTLLLMMTLVRLSLNVATSRLILLKGTAGMIVAAFGGFVVGGNLIVGLVIFLILVIIQFVVITKGASRISEVAARFTLDAMPGKQMAIDAEMNAGSINEAEARRRRQQLVREAEFYGAMDGAGKFVRGDAIAGLVITAVNLIGGIALGLTRNESIGHALRAYSILTVGDGLISQIPALIVATASGMLVTKASSQTGLGQELGLQMLTNPFPLRVGAGIMAGLALVPGLPRLPFLALAAGLWILARRLSQRQARQVTEPAATPAKAAPEMHFDDLLQSDRAGVEIGARLIPLVDSRPGPNLLERIGGLRRELAKRNGLWVPPVRVRDNIQLEPDLYRFLINGREVARGRIRADRWLAIDPGNTRFSVDGEPTRDPAFGLPARWIVEADRQRAELGGFTVVDASSVLVTHLGEIVRRHSHELLSREDLKALVEKVKETSPTVVDELIPNVMTMGVLHRVLCLLLEERVPISNLTRILESLANHAGVIKDPVDLVERVRTDVGRAVCAPFRDEQGRLHVLVLEPRLEMECRKAVHEKTLAVEPVRLEKIIANLANEWKKANARGQEVALLTDAVLRRPLRQALARGLPDLAVIAYGEVPGDMPVEPVAAIRIEEVAASTIGSPSANMAEGLGLVGSEQRAKAA
jgi:flagellar biosynthesis protein FlhA